MSRYCCASTTFLRQPWKSRSAGGGGGGGGTPTHFFFPTSKKFPTNFQNGVGVLSWPTTTTKKLPPLAPPLGLTNCPSYGLMELPCLSWWLEASRSSLLQTCKQAEHKLLLWSLHIQKWRFSSRLVTVSWFNQIYINSWFKLSKWILRLELLAWSNQWHKIWDLLCPFLAFFIFLQSVKSNGILRQKEKNIGTKCSTLLISIGLH